MQRALLRAGIDAAKILGRAPQINACLTEPLFFPFGGVDRALLRFADEPNYAPRFNCLKLCVDPTLSYLKIQCSSCPCSAPNAARRVSFWHSQSNASAHSNRLRTERADVDIANCALSPPSGVLNRSARMNLERSQLDATNGNFSTDPISTIIGHRRGAGLYVSPERSTPRTTIDRAIASAEFIEVIYLNIRPVT
jgi:hypothetical protein